MKREALDGAGAWQERKRQIRARLEGALASSKLRSPEQVLEQLSDRAAHHRGRGPLSDRATVVVQAPGATVGDIRNRLGDMPGGAELARLGFDVTPLAVGKAPPRYFEIALPMRERQMRREIHNVAWALRKGGIFAGAWAGTRKVYLFAAGDPTHATEAPRTFAWHLDMIRGRQAHVLEPGVPEGAQRGAGAVVAHPDTGWAPHPEYARDQIDVGLSHNTITGETGQEETAQHSIDIDDASAPNITHGTATAGLIVGGPASERPDIAALTEEDLEFEFGEPKPQVDEGHVIGVAPEATVVPIRFISNDMIEISQEGVQGAGVVRLGDAHFVEFLDYATSIGADVMSLSVGGILSGAVRDAFDEAILEHDLIVAAAAGQTYAFNILSVLSENDSVIEPARFRNVIAVAGCSPDGRPWDESHRGPNVDITAPADGVWVPDFDTERSDEATDDRLPILTVGSGTSFATSITAGAAALWVAHWGGRGTLKQTYPDTPLAWVFREVLQRSARPVFDAPWDSDRFGPGVLNLERMLEEPLPPPDEVPEPPATVANLLTTIEDGLVLLGEIRDWLGDRWRDAEGAVQQGIVVAAALFDQGLQLAEDVLAAGYAAAEEVAGDARDAWSDAVAAGEELVADAAAAAEDMADAAAETGEDVVEGLVEVVEEGGEVVGEAVEAIVGWFS